MLVNSVMTGGTKTARPEHETDQIRQGLQDRFDELHAEYEQALADNQTLRLVEMDDAAGDDSADSGTKVAEREAAALLLQTVLERRDQFARALESLDAGTYGYCESCTKPIPVERLAIFPSATTCVACKSNRERRAF